MRVYIEVESTRRKTTVERSSHPVDAGDMQVLSRLLDDTYREARAWMDRELNPPAPTESNAGQSATGNRSHPTHQPQEQ